MKSLKKFLNLFCKEGLEESMKGSEFIFDSINILYYNLNKISLDRGETYIDTPECIKNKKSNNNF